MQSSRGGRVWSCVDCHLVHKKEIAQKILDCLMQEGDTDELVKVAWKKSNGAYLMIIPDSGHLALVLLLAAVIDIVFGEPPAAVHPVVWIGKLINFFEKCSP
nr:cobalamin biosynthesis protein [Methanosarcina horonobensis]